MLLQIGVTEWSSAPETSSLRKLSLRRLPRSRRLYQSVLAINLKLQSSNSPNAMTRKAPPSLRDHRTDCVWRHSVKAIIWLHNFTKRTQSKQTQITFHNPKQTQKILPRDLKQTKTILLESWSFFGVLQNITPLIENHKLKFDEFMIFSDHLEQCLFASHKELTYPSRISLAKTHYHIQHAQSLENRLMNHQKWPPILGIKP